LARGRMIPQVSKQLGITEQTYYRWRKEFGGLRLDQTKRLNQLEQENARLKRVVADLTLDNAMLKEVADPNFFRRTLRRQAVINGRQRFDVSERRVCWVALSSI